jgi:hypothetical protein
MALDAAAAQLSQSILDDSYDLCFVLCNLQPDVVAALHERFAGPITSRPGIR